MKNKILFALFISILIIIDIGFLVFLFLGTVQVTKDNHETTAHHVINVMDKARKQEELKTPQQPKVIVN